MRILALSSLWTVVPLYHLVIATFTRSDWDVAYQQARKTVASLSADEKATIVTGTGDDYRACTGSTKGLDRIGLPALCFNDGPAGVVYSTGVTSFPAGIHVAASWNEKLAYERAFAMGEEAKLLGVHALLGVEVGPLGKIPQAGRNWESFGPDPYLAGKAAETTVTGIQAAGVQAVMKYFVGNEQETNKKTLDARIDDTTLQEMYLWPFAEGISVGAAGIMCSHNLVNGEHACESQTLLTEILKKGMGFRGYVISDRYAQYSLAKSANAGLDVSMPGAQNSDVATPWWGSNLVNAVPDAVTMARLDDMAIRVLTPWYMLKQQNYPGTRITHDIGDYLTLGNNVQDGHGLLARKIGYEGMVLLKNVNSTLPLLSKTSVAVIGEDGFNNLFGNALCIRGACSLGTLVSGWGSSFVKAPYVISPWDAFRKYGDSQGVLMLSSRSNSKEAAIKTVEAVDIAVVCISARSGQQLESLVQRSVDGVPGDRPNLDPWQQGNELVQAVARDANKKTIVVVHSVGPVILESILALDNVVAVIWAGLPGQESGNALLDILYGAQTPSGKLPFTIAKKESDYATRVVQGKTDKFSEGLLVDYRAFDARGIEPRYEFGYGLSYTTFQYSNLKLNGTVRAGPATGLISFGGPADLFTTVVTVQVTIQNTGKVLGAEVAQLYVSLPRRPSPTALPPRQLRGFAKTFLEAGATGTVEFKLRRKDLSYWDVKLKRFVVPKGPIEIYVGASSRDYKRLTGTIDPK